MEIIDGYRECLHCRVQYGRRRRYVVVGDPKRWAGLREGASKPRRSARFDAFTLPNEVVPKAAVHLDRPSHTINLHTRLVQRVEREPAGDLLWRDLQAIECPPAML